MSKYSLLLLLLCLYNSSRGQIFCLKSKATQTSIEYAHIAFIGSTNGTYSDENGCFSLKEDVDSLFISHISFKDTLLPVRGLPDTIYLNVTENQLTDIVVSAKSNSKKKRFKLPKKEGCRLNVPSFEIGKVVEKHRYEKWSSIERIYFPLKIGEEVPLLGVNLYIFNSDTNKPDSLIWSGVIKDENQKRRMVVLDDLSIGISNYDNLFVSIELIGYVQEGKNEFSSYSNSKDALKIYLSKSSNENAYQRVKNVKEEWFPIAKGTPFLLNKEPVIQVDIE